MARLRCDEANHSQKSTLKYSYSIGVNQSHIVFSFLYVYICFARKSTIMLIREIAAAANTTARTIQRDIEAYNKANGTEHLFGLKDDVTDAELLMFIRGKRNVRFDIGYDADRMEYSSGGSILPPPR